MKQFLYISILALLCTGCKDSATESANDYGYGTARIAAVASSEVEVQTRTTAQLPTGLLPDASEFSLHITGTYEDQEGQHTFDQSWASFTELEELNTRRGEYKAAIAYGDPEVEGKDKPCFGGEVDFAVLARNTVEVTVSAGLTNAAFRVAFDEWFGKYYTDVAITIRTESGATFDYTGSDDELIFVKPDTKLYMKGTAVKSQTGAEVEFPEAEIGLSKPRTLHTIVIGASQVGEAGLEIVLNDTFTKVKERVIELNDEADPVK